MIKTSVPKKFLIVLLLISLVLFLVHVALKYISVVIFNEQHGALFELSARFDVNDENSVPQWFSQLIFLLIGVTALFAAYLNKAKSSRTLWIVIGALGMLLSLDDVATLHEFVLQSLHNTFFLDSAPSLIINAWLIVLPFVLLIGAGLAWWSWKALPNQTMLWLVAGGLVYVLGKIMMDSIANTTTDLFLDRGIMQGLEKVFQYTGSSIILYSILDYLSTNHGAKIKKALSQLR